VYANKLENILSLRHEIANILGFESFVESSAWNRFLKSSSEIKTMLNNLHSSNLSTATRELEVILNRKRDAERVFKDESSLPNQLFPWDSCYHYRRTTISHDISHYFSLGNCLDGLAILCRKLFNIEIVIADVSLDEVAFCKYSIDALLTIRFTIKIMFSNWNSMTMMRMFCWAISIWIYLRERIRARTTVLIR
jgi:Zn-dependent oligopeptidase